MWDRTQHQGSEACAKKRFTCWLFRIEPLPRPNSWIGSVSCRQPVGTATGGSRRNCNPWAYDITIEEVQALGRSLAGRPHFARLMVQKGYVPNTSEAFRLYLDESAPGYVEREEPLSPKASSVSTSGWDQLARAPRPSRQTRSSEEEELISGFVALGLDAIEAYHSDHDARDVQRYFRLRSEI